MLNAVDAAAAVVVLGVLYHRRHLRGVAEAQQRARVVEYVCDEMKMPYF